MCASDTQIKQLFEQGGLTPEEIAGATGYAESAVKNSLANNSTVYRKAVASATKQEVANGVNQPEADVSDEEFLEIKRGLMEIAREADPTYVPTRARVLMFLFNEKKGRNNVDKLNGNRTNVFLINQGIVRAKQIVSQALDVDATVSQQ